MTHALVLGRRALREGIRTPEAIVPTLFIPLFFLVVNVGQVARIFPGSSTAFLHGQGYGAFQLPSSMLLAASFGSAASSWSRRSKAATSTSCARRPFREARSLRAVWSQKPS